MKTLYTGVLVLLLSAIAAFASEFAEQEIQTVVPEAQASRPELKKQPVFLFSPHKEGAGSWSLYVVVDKNDPSKALGLGLEELAGKNSKEHTYRGVLAAQKDPNTQRNELGYIGAESFASGSLEVKDNNLLSIRVNPAEDGLKLTIDARISIDGHFVVGGPEQNRRSLMLQYSSLYKCWQTKALKLENSNGQNAVGRFGMTLTGIIFTAGTTMVSKICAVDEFGAAVVLMDR